MFSEIDKTIFPDSCEVLEIIPSQLFVYPIFKNGSSSLFRSAIPFNWRTLNQDNIHQIQEPITVFLRNPRERFISGVNTFLQHCLRDHPDLDTKTILFFVQKYLFLNRHYAPQFFWLINLSRYTKTSLKFCSIDNISSLTSLHSRPEIEPQTEEFLTSIKNFPWQQLELYFLLDQLLIDRIGQEISFGDLIIDIKKNHRYLYDLIFAHCHNIIDVLPKT
jgi:hypothetical protein